MNRQVLWFVLFTLLAACSSSGSSNTNNSPGNTGGTGNSIYTGGLIIDHRAVAGFDRGIPAEYLVEAKQRTIHYARTSHGRQIIEGALKLDEVSAATSTIYSFAVNEDGNAATLPDAPGALRMYDGNGNLSGNTYITPDLYWEEAEGMTATRGVASTGLFDYSMWSWCGQVSYYSSASIQTYLDNLDTLENEYVNMRFIYMTGHTDGTGTNGTLNINNNMIRQYVSDNNKVLFDFADIESYDPGGTLHADTGYQEGFCNWCKSWCDAHPSDCTDLPDSCGHTDSIPEAKLVCKLKAKAFWYMMARLAGWNDPLY